jgi:hypothetical protein
VHGEEADNLRRLVFHPVGNRGQRVRRHWARSLYDLLRALIPCREVGAHPRWRENLGGKPMFKLLLPRIRRPYTLPPQPSATVRLGKGLPLQDAELARHKRRGRRTRRRPSRLGLCHNPSGQIDSISRRSLSLRRRFATSSRSRFVGTPSPPLTYATNPNTPSTDIMS